MTLAIREATPEDYDGLSALYAEIDGLHARALPRIFQPTGGPARSPAYLRSLLDNPDIMLYVAELDGELAGLVDVRLETTPDAPIFVPRRYAMIDTVVVRERYQRRGVGRALMAQAEAWARAHGAHDIDLNVWEFNAGAVAFYEELGYTTALRRMWRRLDE